MQKRLIIFLVLFFLIANISGVCEKSQININSASLEELDELYGIGLVKAQSIIDTRPFESVNDLIHVNGIGPVTLENIKNQGLACVDTEEETLKDEDSYEEDSNFNDEENKKENSEISGKIINEKIIEKETIFLEPKDIKTKTDKDDERKINYPLIGIIFFCVLIGFLYLINEKRYKKNEFKE